MTDQEILDTVARHLSRQGHRAMRGYVPAACAYRSPNGDKCAFGALIPDELYRWSMEGKRSSEVLGAYASLADQFEGQADLIGRLQAVHDGPQDDRNPIAIGDRLIAIAKIFCLNADVIRSLLWPAVWH